MIPNTDTPPSFEVALRELESIVQTMETGDAPIEESLAAYERGIALVKHCQSMLSVAEQRLHVLEGGELREFTQESE